jgi:hypothetical protein
MVAPVAERLVVDALLMVDVPVTCSSPVTVKPVVLRFVVDAFVITPLVAVRLVVLAVCDVRSVSVVVASVVVPVNVLSPANDWVVVDISPRAVSDALGIMNECVVPTLRIVKSVAPVDEAVKVCTDPTSPLRELIPPVADPESTMMTLPLASRESATPLYEEVAEEEVRDENLSPATVDVAVEVKRRDVDVSVVRDPMNADVSVAPTADRLVVDASVSVEDAAVRREMNPLMIDAPLAEKLVDEAVRKLDEAL